MNHSHPIPGKGVEAHHLDSHGTQFGHDEHVQALRQAGKADKEGLHSVSHSHANVEETVHPERGDLILHYHSPKAKAEERSEKA